MGESVKCPFCGEENGDLWPFDWEGVEDEEKEIECDECERKFAVARVTNISFEVRKPD